LTSIPDQYHTSGKITAEVKSLVKTKVSPGMGYLEICEFVKREVESRGGRLAFPTGIGVNAVTAHYAPQDGDRGVVSEKDLVKVDFGVHVEGYVTDTSVSLTFNPEYNLLLEATERCLEAAISTARRDQRTAEIGREIHREAARFGFKTIENLTGHTVDRYVVHAGKSIPNLYMPGMQTLKKGEVFAIEPFLTPGSAAGYVVDHPSTTIFSVAVRKKTGTPPLHAAVVLVRLPGSKAARSDRPPGGEESPAGLPDPGRGFREPCRSIRAHDGSRRWRPCRPNLRAWCSRRRPG
jgi:methionyl aminopeptidase